MKIDGTTTDEWAVIYETGDATSGITPSVKFINDGAEALKCRVFTDDFFTTTWNETEVGPGVKWVFTDRYSEAPYKSIEISVKSLVPGAHTQFSVIGKHI
jgi:hypothetical protein